MPTDQKNQQQSILDLEGDKKVVRVIYLVPNYIKGILLGLPLIISVVGIYFLVKFKLFRSKIFFNGYDDFDPQKTTHLYIENNDQETELISMIPESYMNQNHYTFVSHNLKYQIKESKIYPLSVERSSMLQKALKQTNGNQPLSGLSCQEHKARLDFFGRNEHNIEIPNYFVYSFQVMTQPLFMFQYIFVTNMFLHAFLVPAILIVTMLFLMVFVNYLFVYFNLKKVKAEVLKQYNVKALRSGKYQDIECTKLVPGDIYIVGDAIPCDSVLISGGQIIVNEANFTGQNIPILKSKLRSIEAMQNRQHWIFDGSQILQKKGEVIVMAVYTGYTSHRGRIIRKIINISVREPAFAKSIIFFAIINVVITSLVFLSIIPMLQGMQMTPAKISSEYVLMLGFSITFVGFIYMFPSFSLRRLKEQQINGNQAYSIYEVGKVKIMCFDKTGTLTENQIQLASIFKIHSGSCFNITDQLEDEQNRLMRCIFASCHMINAKQGEKQLKGDEIDLRMWEKSKANFLPSTKEGILWSVQVSDNKFDILRINQFESRFMSMSVLARDEKNKKYYVFVKGSPELVLKHAKNNCKEVPQLLKNINLEGFRAIGIGFKKINEPQIQKYLKADRQIYLEGVQMLGIISFINKLKQEAPDVIGSLRNQCGIKVHMITGDNIYTAVNTGLRAGIISSYEEIAICQDHNIIDPQLLSAKITIISTKGQQQIYQERQLTIQSFPDYFANSPPNLIFAIDKAFLIPQIYQLSLLPKIRIFARMSPENKTQIVKHIQQSLQEQYDSRSFLKRLIGNYRSNVGMVGDGANDLMAIKGADVGFGIHESDGTFSADFIIKQLQDIEKVIREGKAISQRAIQTIYIPASTNLFNIPLLIMLFEGMSTLNQVPLIVVFGYYFMPMPFLLSMTKPQPSNTPLIPDNNFISKNNLLKFWFLNLVYAFSFLLAYICLWTSPSYIHLKPYPITLTTHLHSYSQSSTLFFKILLIAIPAVILIYYDNSMFKQALWEHPLIKKWLIVGGVLMVVAQFVGQYISFLQIMPIDIKLTLKVMGIELTASLICYYVVRKVPGYYTDPIFNNIQDSQKVTKNIGNQELSSPQLSSC